jgi:hypothetical protein
VCLQLLTFCSKLRAKTLHIWNVTVESDERMIEKVYYGSKLLSVQRVASQGKFST